MSRDTDGTIAFGDVLRRLRMQRSLSQEELAERASLSLNAVSALERGVRRRPRVETVRVLCDAMNLAGAERRELERAADRARRPRGSSRNGLRTAITTLTSFIGRSREVDVLHGLLLHSPALTITGSGGIGKTRIALELASRLASQFSHGGWVVDLRGVDNASLVISKIVEAMAISNSNNDVNDALAMLVTDIEGISGLLLIDNCDGVIDEVARVVERLLTASGLRILCTSREPLHIAGETVYPLPTLALPRNDASTDELVQCDSVRLFLERSHWTGDVSPEKLAAVASICRKLDGVALAIELAAAELVWSDSTERMSVLLRSLDDARRDTQTLPWQTALDAAISWSYSRLTEAEQKVFRRLSVFSGGCSREAARSVCRGTDLSAGDVAFAVNVLVDRSLLEADSALETARYRLLEPVRSFAMAQFSDRDERRACLDAKAGWMAALADQANGELWNGPYADWVARYIPELDNARSAVEWALTTSNHAAVAGRIVAGLRGLWLFAGAMSELRSAAERTLAKLDVTDHPQLAGQLHRALMVAGFDSGPEFMGVLDRATRSLARAGDRLGLGTVHCYRGIALGRSGRFAEAVAEMDLGIQTISAAGGSYSAPLVSFACNRIVYLIELGRLDEARASIVDAKAVASNLDDHLPLGETNECESRLAFACGDYNEALRLLRSNLRQQYFPRDSVDEGYTHTAIAAVHLAQGKAQNAFLSAQRGAIAVRRRNRFTYFESLHVVAGAFAANGRLAEAASLYGFLEGRARVTHWAQQIFARRSLELSVSILDVHWGSSARQAAQRVGAGLTDDDIFRLISQVPGTRWRG
jgi:predicted ATPase/DNA-binding XRE family transcriptional regulator